MLSIQVFRCLPLLLSPTICSYTAAFGSLLPSIRLTWPYHLSLLLLILSTTVSSAPRSFLVCSYLILSLLLLPMILLSHSISATSSLLSSSFLRHQHSDPYSNTGSSRV